MDLDLPQQDNLNTLAAEKFPGIIEVADGSILMGFVRIAQRNKQVKAFNYLF